MKSLRVLLLSMDSMYLETSQSSLQNRSWFFRALLLNTKIQRLKLALMTIRTLKSNKMRLI